MWRGTESSASHSRSHLKDPDTHKQAGQDKLSKLLPIIAEPPQSTVRRNLQPTNQLTSPSKVDVSQADVGRSKFPSYLLGKDPYGRILDTHGQPRRGQQIPAKSPPSQLGSSIGGRRRTSGTFRVTSRPASSPQPIPPPAPEQRILAKPTPKTSPLPSRRPPDSLSVKDAKILFERKATESRANPPVSYSRPPNIPKYATPGSKPTSEPVQSISLTRDKTEGVQNAEELSVWAKRPYIQLSAPRPPPEVVQREPRQRVGAVVHSRADAVKLPTRMETVRGVRTPRRRRSSTRSTEVTGSVSEDSLYAADLSASSTPMSTKQEAKTYSASSNNRPLQYVRSYRVNDSNGRQMDVAEPREIQQPRTSNESVRRSSSSRRLRNAKVNGSIVSAPLASDSKTARPQPRYDVRRPSTAQYDFNVSYDDQKRQWSSWPSSKTIGTNQFPVTTLSQTRNKGREYHDGSADDDIYADEFLRPGKGFSTSQFSDASNNERILVRDFGEQVDLSSKPTDNVGIGLSHCGFSAYPSFMQRHSLQSTASDTDTGVQEKYCSVENPHSVNQSAFNRHEKMIPGSPGARTRPYSTLGPWIWKVPLQDPGNWAKRACGHFAAKPSSECHEDESDRLCRHCQKLERVACSQPRYPRKYKRTASDASIASQCDFTRAPRPPQSPRWLRSHSIVNDRCGDTFVEDLGYAIDCILEEHHNTLQSIIDNIRLSQPGLARLQRVSEELIQRCLDTGVSTRSPRKSQMACCSLESDKDPKRATNGDCEPLNYCDQTTHRQNIRSAEKLLEFLKYSADDLGVDLNKKPTPEDDVKFQRAPVERFPRLSLASQHCAGFQPVGQSPEYETDDNEDSWLHETHDQLAELAETQSKLIHELHSFAWDFGVNVRDRRQFPVSMDLLQHHVSKTPRYLFGKRAQIQNKSTRLASEARHRSLNQVISAKRLSSLISCAWFHSERMSVMSKNLQYSRTASMKELQEWIDGAQSEMAEGISVIIDILNNTISQDEMRSGRQGGESCNQHPINDGLAKETPMSGVPKDPAEEIQDQLRAQTVRSCAEGNSDNTIEYKELAVKMVEEVRKEELQSGSPFTTNQNLGYADIAESPTSATEGSEGNHVASETQSKQVCSPSAIDDEDGSGSCVDCQCIDLEPLNDVKESHGLTDVPKPMNENGSGSAFIADNTQPRCNVDGTQDNPKQSPTAVFSAPEAPAQSPHITKSEATEDQTESTRRPNKLTRMFTVPFAKPRKPSLDTPTIIVTPTKAKTEEQEQPPANFRESEGFFPKPMLPASNVPNRPQPEVLGRDPKVGKELPSMLSVPHLSTKSPPASPVITRSASQSRLRQQSPKPVLSGLPGPDDGGASLSIRSGQHPRTQRPYGSSLKARNLESLTQYTSIRRRAMIGNVRFQRMVASPRRSPNGSNNNEDNCITIPVSLVTQLQYRERAKVQRKAMIASMRRSRPSQPCDVASSSHSSVPVSAADSLVHAAPHNIWPHPRPTTHEEGGRNTPVADKLRASVKKNSEPEAPKEKEISMANSPQREPQREEDLSTASGMGKGVQSGIKRPIPSTDGGGSTDDEKDFSSATVSRINSLPLEAGRERSVLRRNLLRSRTSPTTECITRVSTPSQDHRPRSRSQSSDSRQSSIYRPIDMHHPKVKLAVGRWISNSPMEPIPTSDSSSTRSTRSRSNTITSKGSSLSTSSSSRGRPLRALTDPNLSEILGRAGGIDSKNFSRASSVTGGSRSSIVSSRHSFEVSSEALTRRLEALGGTSRSLPARFSSVPSEKGSCLRRCSTTTTLASSGDESPRTKGQMHSTHKESQSLTPDSVRTHADDGHLEMRRRHRPNMVSRASSAQAVSEGRLTKGASRDESRYRHGSLSSQHQAPLTPSGISTPPLNPALQNRPSPQGVRMLETQKTSPLHVVVGRSPEGQRRKRSSIRRHWRALTGSNFSNQGDGEEA